jgi:ectoine hydroxylase-related dioxygenase (phytanoyl-CoA dioxygenase family)
MGFVLTDRERALLPSDDEVAFFEEQGYYASRPGVIPEALLDRARDGAERFYRGERDARLPVDSGYSNWTPADGDGPRNNEFVSLQKTELMDLVRHPLIGAIAARLTRSDSIRLLDDQLIYKPSKAGDAATTVTGWHADGAYWGTCSSEKLITAWIPLHDVSVERGPLVVMAGSHRWSGLEDIRHFNRTNLAELEEQFRQGGKNVRVVPMAMKMGQVSFHHRWTVHASFPNVSGQPRLSLAAHLQDGDNRYRPARTADGREIHIFDERICRKTPGGEPDFSDPSVFPTLWSGGCGCAP